MSTERKMSDILREEMAKQQVEIDALKKSLTTLTAEKPLELPKEHDTVEAIDNCPNCRVKMKVDEYKAKVSKDAQTQALKEIVDKAKGKYHCVGCGLKVERETEKCPLCGGTKAE